MLVKLQVSISGMSHGGALTCQTQRNEEERICDLKWNL